MGNQAACCCESDRTATSAGLLEAVPTLSEKAGNAHEDQEVPEVRNSAVFLPPRGGGDPPGQHEAQIRLKQRPSQSDSIEPPQPATAEPSPVKQNAQVEAKEEPKREAPAEKKMEPARDAATLKDSKLVTIAMQEGKKLGLAIYNLASEDFVRVGAVHEGGLVQKWNEGHPDKAVQKGDKILDVNGSTSAEEIRMRLRERAATLKILFQP
eukprot:CAMPEP_0178404526 /NCGR_PEP_ID=MMETSP0689_2-20121128/17931_1 /TAXON_ID=160604 /ORGANISM="Amphidinium massartii, Strain CS-259" /LENGTH=209 /DNA_ID=CAMNT_0020025517 /DNA_START=122 /DNA_END=747 /DNA_ORIENTATION=-